MFADEMVSVQPDMAGEIDSPDDFYREVISREWPGKDRPSIKAIDAILKMVNGCINAAKQAGLIESSEFSQADVVGKILGLVETPLEFHCLRFCFDLEPMSQTEIGERYGVTKQRVSQLCVELCDQLGIAPSRGMRKMQSRDSYRERAKDVHSRPKEPASFQRQNIFTQSLNYAA